MVLSGSSLRLLGALGLLLYAGAAGIAGNVAGTGLVGAGLRTLVAVEVGEGFGVVGDHGVEVEGLRVGEVGVGDGYGDIRPVGAEPASEAVGVVASAEVVVAGFGVAFFAFEKDRAEKSLINYQLGIRRTKNLRTRTEKHGSDAENQGKDSRLLKVRREKRVAMQR